MLLNPIARTKPGAFGRFCKHGGFRQRLFALLPGLFFVAGAFDLAAASRTRVGLQALYDFSAGSGYRIQDHSGEGSAIDLLISEPEAVRWTENGLQLQQPTQIRSDKPAYKLNEAIRRSGEITVEAWITPANLDQKGPARIVTLSGNSSERNFTLGQDADKYDFRLRTLKTGNNGSNPSLSAKTDQTAARQIHLAYTRNRAGKARLYLDGQNTAEKTITGAVGNWDRQFRLALGNEFGADRAWLGTYHLVAVYARALFPKEIEAHYQAGPDAETPPPALAHSPSPNAKLFNAKIAPLLVEHCFECHDTATQKGELDLSRRDAAFAGSSSGKVIIPGNAMESYLLESVMTDEMPKDREPLSVEEKAWLKAWIAGGASWPIEAIDPAAFVHGGETGENWLRRLTVSEYIESVRSAVGIDIAREAHALLPRDLRADGFSNTAYNLSVDLKHVNAYAQLAEKIVAQMDVEKFAGRFSKSRLLTDDSMRGLVKEMGKWILRGPLESHEITLYRGLSTTAVAAGGDFKEAVTLIIDAMLQSPRFLYRIENQRGDGAPWLVTEHELASRMSYILWGAPPDKPLVEAAESGSLFTAAGLNEQIARMLQDPRAVKRSKDFIAEWLHLDRLNNLRPNAEKFPAWEHQLAFDMKQETLAFFEDIVWKQKRSLHDLFDAQFTYATPKLAVHYGLPAETALAQYDLSNQPGRGGLLTHGSVLTVGGDEASMVSRGLFVLHDLLRGVVKDPPPCVDTTPVPTRPGLTQRAIAEQRIANVRCGGCHGKFEPLAFGLEKFDGVGAYHETDEHGNQLRDDGEILFPGTAETAAYNSSEQLMQMLADSKRLRESLTWKLTQFALGRPLVFSDTTAVDKIHQKAQKDGGTYQSLITEIIKSDLVQTTLTEASQ